jgi:hypothetical protein
VLDSKPLIAIALVLGLAACKKDPPSPAGDDATRAEPVLAQPSPEPPVFDAAGPLDAASSPDAGPRIELPGWLRVLGSLADLICSCTTPSCVYRYTVKIEAARKAVPELEGSRWQQDLAAIEERIAGCQEVASADGLGEPDDSGSDDAGAGQP